MSGQACAQIDCDGSIASDGYCDTCGSRAPAASSPSPAAPNAAPAAPPPPSPAAPSVRAQVGRSCAEPGCDGSVAADGYCDTCGALAGPAARPTGSTPQIAPRTAGVPTIAAAESPTVASRLGSRSARSRRGSDSQRTRRASAAIGAGLVEVAPTPVGDPAAAVMSDEKIASIITVTPEDERFCGNCGSEVGRSSGDREGRVSGFCSTCRTQFDFASNAPKLVAGEMVANQYEILGPLAHGGMGWIYLGRDKAVSDRWVVLKGLLRSDDPDAAAAAVAERQFLARIEHGAIVNIYNFVTHRGAGYIVMEFVGGESLNQKLKARRADNGGVPDPLPVAEAIAYILATLPAFGYLHGLGLVYNDLKPANVMATGDQVKLIDVGAVMQADDAQAAIFGTQGFQAPEMAEMGPSVASDLYTVGRTLAVLILNFVFHSGPYQYELPGPDTEPLFAQWESLHRFLLKATASHPDDRFQTAEEMAEQLTGVLRSVVAQATGERHPTPSALFGGDRLTSLLADADSATGVTEAEWSALPLPRVDPADAAASTIIDLAEVEPASVYQLLQRAVTEGQVPATVEVRLRQVRALIDQGINPSKVLDEISGTDPWEWRADWYRALWELSQGDGAHAAARFSRVWTDLPGELAPRLAVALAAESAGELGRAADLYDEVARIDPTFVSAAFGLARCRKAEGDRDGAVAAYARIAPSSATWYDAQIASARTLVDRELGNTDPTAADLAAAASTIDRLQLEGAERARLAAEILERAQGAVTEGGLAQTGVQLFGQPLDEDGVARGLETTYRELARLTDDNDAKISWVDKANAVRPRSLL